MLDNISKADLLVMAVMAGFVVLYGVIYIFDYTEIHLKSFIGGLKELQKGIDDLFKLLKGEKKS